MKTWTTSFLLVALACTFGLLGGGIVMYLRQAEASRNSAGTYSLATSPVTTLQTISTSLWNNTFSDLATGVTDSLDRNGRGGMLAALRGIDGTVAAPALSYTSETGSGEYRIGAGDLGWAILGGKKLELTSSLFTVTPAASFNSTLAVTGTSTLTGDVTASGHIGIGGAPTNLLDMTITGTATTNLGSWLQASLADGNKMTLNIGKVASNGGLGIVTYTKNATALNSTLCLDVFGQASTLCVDGNGKTYVGSSSPFTVDSSGNVTTTALMTVGSGGTNFKHVHFGSCTLDGGSHPGGQCTATVGTSATCTANIITTTAANTRDLGISVSSTTLTITSQTNGDAFNVAYICFSSL